MYQELLNVRYRHEYFEGSNYLDLHCELSTSAHKLCDSMDAVIIPSLGSLRLLWNDQRYNKEELKNNFHDENLLLYFYPKDSDLFFSVTSKLRIIKEETYIEREDGSVDVEGECPCFYAFQWLDTNNKELHGVSEPTDKLFYVSSLADLKTIKDINLSEKNEPVKMDADIKQLLALSNRRPIIVLNIPMANLLNFESKNSLSLNMCFETKSVVYKYYFLGLKPDKALKIINESDSSKNTESVITYTAHEESIDGEKTVPTFISDGPIKLKDRPSDIYKLVRYEPGDSVVKETVVGHLPHPKPTQYFKHKQEGNHTVTVLEAFIH